MSVSVSVHLSPPTSPKIYSQALPQEVSRISLIHAISWGPVIQDVSLLYLNSDALLYRWYLSSDEGDQALVCETDIFINENVLNR